MFVNLHRLPAGQHLYTAFVGDLSGHDEVDFTAGANLTVLELIEVAEQAVVVEGYNREQLLAFADQSTSEGILWRADGINGEDLAS